MQKTQWKVFRSTAFLRKLYKRNLSSLDLKRVQDERRLQQKYLAANRCCLSWERMMKRVELRHMEAYSQALKPEKNPAFGQLDFRNVMDSFSPSPSPHFGQEFLHLLCLLNLECLRCWGQIETGGSLFSWRHDLPHSYCVGDRFQQGESSNEKNRSVCSRLTWYNLHSSTDPKLARLFSYPPRAIWSIGP